MEPPRRRWWEMPLTVLKWIGIALAFLVVPFVAGLILIVIGLIMNPF
jgi:hypothetical protein